MFVLFIFRCCFLSVLCWRTQILMILWCLRLLTCIRQTGTNMKQLLGAGPRSMPWAKQALVCEGRAPLFSLYFSAYVSMFVVSSTPKWTKEEVHNISQLKMKETQTHVWCLVVVWIIGSLAQWNMSVLTLFP